MRFAILFAGLVSFTVVEARAEELKWSAKSGVRFTRRVHNDGLETRNAAGKDSSKSTNDRYEMRAGLGVSGKAGPVEWGVAVRTQAAATNEWVQVQSAQDRGIGVELAYGRYVTTLFDGDFLAIFGRQKPLFLFDGVGQILVDSDVRFDGFGWNWKKGNFGLVLTQYVQGARSLGVAGASTFTHTEATDASPDTQGGFAWKLSFQPSYKWKISEDMEAQFALGYHHSTGTSGNSAAGFFNNAIHGGQAGTAGVTTAVSMDNARQWQALAITTLPWRLRASAEYVRNKKTLYGTRAAPTNKETDNVAYSIGLAWNKVKSAGDWAATYHFVHKGVGSVVGAYSDGDVSPDLAGHLLGVTYGLAESVNIIGRYLNFHELGKVDGNGLSLTGANSKRFQTLRRYDLILGIAF